MAPPALGTIEAVKPAGKRRVFGRDTDGWTDARARSELDDIRAQLKAGIPLAQILEEVPA